MTMSFSQSPAKRSAAACSLFFAGGLVVSLFLLPARLTNAQDEQAAAPPTAPAEAAEREAEDTASEPVPENPPEPAPESTAPQPDAQPELQPDAGNVEPTADPEWVAKGVWTLPPTEGAVATDFSLVGEYLGVVRGAESQPAADSAAEPTADAVTATTEVRRGIQIRNLGDGEFEARVYSGGLPGQDGFQNDDPMVLLGRRSGQTLVLSGGPWAMFVTPTNCKIIDATGATLGTLDRIERQSPTLGATPPEGAIVLFDGSDTSAFMNGEMNSQSLLTQGADIREMLGDFDMHVEFRIPHMPKLRDQQRGNSGLYLQSRYECQVLDSFGDANVFNGLGALYRYKAPKMNMAFPPLSWQSYDVHFTAARFAADGSKVRNARITTWVNGVMVQDDEELPGPTGAGKEESPTLLPTKIQDHNDPVRFRNIWVIDRGLTGGIAFPQMATPAAQD